MQKVLLSMLQNVSLSLNMDESTSSNIRHMFTILPLVYFSECAMTLWLNT